MGGEQSTNTNTEKWRKVKRIKRRCTHETQPHTETSHMVREKSGKWEKKESEIWMSEWSNGHGCSLCIDCWARLAIGHRRIFFKWAHTQHNKTNHKITTARFHDNKSWMKRIAIACTQNGTSRSFVVFYYFLFVILPNRFARHSGRSIKLILFCLVCDFF